MTTALCLALTLLAAGSPPRDDPADALREAERAFFRETRERGLEGWLAWFAEDAVVFPASGALAVGSANVRRHYQGQGGFPPKGFTWEPETAELAPAGDLGWTTGRFGNDASGSPVWSGHYLTVWRKEPDGAWRVVADCTLDPAYAARLPGLTSPPRSSGRETERAFRSSAGDLTATMGSWWAIDESATETGGKFLSIWRRNADGTHELAADTGILQGRR